VLDPRTAIMIYPSARCHAHTAKRTLLALPIMGALLIPQGVTAVASAAGPPAAAATNVQWSIDTVNVVPGHTARWTAGLQL
jgi:hypothetical protein